MSERKWPRRLGPPLILLLATVGGALGALRLLGAADAGPGVQPGKLASCPSRPEVGAEAQPGAWWKLTASIDGAGVLKGRQLFVGRGAGPGGTIALGAESAAYGPQGGVVLVTADDGARSTVRLVSTADGCSWQLHVTGRVARGAVLDTASGTAIVHFVDRATRADLGTWRVGTADAPDGGELLVPPVLGLPADFGPVFVTELRLDALGRLAVQSCGDHGCVTRIVTLGGGGATRFDGPGQGTILGLVGDRLVTWASCPGIACPILAWASGAEEPVTLVETARSAALSADGRYLVAITGKARAIRLDLAGGSPQEILGIRAGEQLLPQGAAAFAGLEVHPDEIALGGPDVDPRPFSPSAAEVRP